MRIVILGAGRRGLRLASHLIKENKDVTLIDSDPERCETATAKIDCLAINGSGTNPSVLKEAGCENADIFIALTESDEINLVSCAIVSGTFKKPRTVATIRSMSYTGEVMETPLLGIDFIVNPFEETANAAYEIVRSGLYLNSSRFPHTPYVMCQLIVTRNASIMGQTLNQIRTKSKTPFVVAGLKRNNVSFLPDGNTVFEEGDDIAIVADSHLMIELLAHFDERYSLSRRTCFIGAGRITRFMLNRFSPNARKNFTIIDSDQEKCQRVARLFPDALVIKGDITEEATWENENLMNQDLLIALTDKDELNIITANYAKSTGIPHAMALVNSNPNYAALARKLDIDTVFSTTETTIDTLLRYIRGENITSVHSVCDGDIEVAEYALSKENEIIGKSLKSLSIAGKMTVLAITGKEGKSVLAYGDYVFREGDRVIVSIPQRHVDLAKDYFS